MVKNFINGAFCIILSSFFGTAALNDAPQAVQNYFQDPATPAMEGIIILHDYIWIFLMFILFFVSVILIRIVFIFKEEDDKEVHADVQHVALEAGWTTTPAIMLCCVATSSMGTLYSTCEFGASSLEVTVVGHQWFWVYEFMVFDKKIAIESHMCEEEDLLVGEQRNLEVDNALVVPVETNIHFLITSVDVIHSWAIPSLAVKVDAVPGRINEDHVFIKRPGRYYGQCSEICGKGHAYMPIVVEAVSREDYNIYLHLLNYRNK